jgi:hypothetical protein
MQRYPACWTSEQFLSAAVVLILFQDFAPSASYFLFARAKEKVTKEKARPTSGFRCAQLPSLRRCSEGRQDGPSLAQHASFGILPNAPLRNTCTRPPDGVVGPSRLVVFRLLYWMPVRPLSPQQALPTNPQHLASHCAASRLREPSHGLGHILRLAALAHGVHPPTGFTNA